MIRVNIKSFLILDDWKCDQYTTDGVTMHDRKSNKGITKNYYVSISDAGTKLKNGEEIINL